MGRFPQKQGEKGSLKWIQILVNRRPSLLNDRIRAKTKISQNTHIKWLSPLKKDRYAEYRDKAFVERLGIDLPKCKLSEFWPRGGPQWDGLGRADDGTVFLIEAKAHISETISHLAAKSLVSKQRILASLQQTKDYLNVKSPNDWASPFYQYANRIAHLYLLRVLNGIPAYLVFVYFLNDEIMGGPKTEEEWIGALKLLHAYLGIGRNKLGKFVIDVFIDVRDLK